MLSTVTIEKAIASLGYQLTERLGAGGYGEVWGATAPGGLPKAIKILYGACDERRAQTELKSLQKIKQIRHPFLLSLERIDVVENQVLIVTELADRSLTDVFEECVRNGLPGIPRKELIGYLRQAAEVLDYLYSEHSLQHLDVKPENLMMVGKHLKLGDFGLIKDLRECRQSMLSGLTPTYSAPELFDGCPSPSSDQYSLAIVYQEMLTGTRPFSGVTPAQLATQHLHEQPDLSPLPKTDQPVVARALSKCAERRFRSCVEFMDHVNDAELLTRKSNRVTILARCMSDTVQKQVVNPDGLRPRLAGQTTRKSITPSAPCEVTWLPGNEFVRDVANLSPVMFIGVGHTGTTVLRRLKSRLQQWAGSMQGLPAYSFLAIESDPSVINEAGVEQHGLAALSNAELLHLPLRKSEYYRTRSAIHSTWLHRRWIFNVPKTLQTEGLRPLGRLAFADHFEAICKRMMAQFEGMTSPEAIARSAQALGLAPADHQPRIVLVGAISGGLASGMLLDLSYLAKATLTELGFSQDALYGMLIHARKLPTSNGELSVANTLAFLSELRHLTQCGYPGDATLGVPEMHDVCPLDWAYLVDLGVDQPDTVWQRHLSDLAEYLQLQHCSPAKSFFDQCRHASSNREYFALRSMGIHHVCQIDQATRSLLAQQCCEQLLGRWLGSGDPTGLDASFVKAMEPCWTPMHWEALFESSALPPEFYAELHADFKQQWQPPLRNEEHILQSLLQQMDDWWEAPRAELHQRSKLANLNEVTDEFVNLHCKELTAVLDEWVARSLAAPRLNFGRLLNTLRAIQGKLEEAAAQQRDQIAQLGGRLATANLLQALPDCAANPSTKRIDWERTLGLVIATKRQLHKVQLSARLMKRLSAEVDQVRERLIATQIQFLHAFQLGPQNPSTSESSQTTADTEIVNPLSRGAAARLTAAIPELIETCLQQVYQQCVQPRGGFHVLLQEFSYQAEGFVQDVLAVIHRELSGVGCRLDYDQMLAASPNGNAIQDHLKQVATQTAPLIQTKSTEARIAICSPLSARATKVEQEVAKALPAPPFVAHATNGDLVVIAEADNVQLADIVFDLIQKHPTTYEMARRVLTRNDVDWLPLDDLL